MAELGGRRLVFWLFMALAAATALALLGFAQMVEPRLRPRVYAALVGNLMLPVIAWFVFKAMNRRRERLTAGGR